MTKLSERFCAAAFAPGLVERGRLVGKLRDEVLIALRTAESAAPTDAAAQKESFVRGEMGMAAADRAQTTLKRPRPEVTALTDASAMREAAAKELWRKMCPYTQSIDTWESRTDEARAYYCGLVDIVLRSLPLPPDTRDGEIAELRAEVARLHERLEDSHVFVWDKATDKMVRQNVEPGSVPDGIECRNDTIKLQDESLDRQRATIATLRSDVATAREALEPFAKAIDNVALPELAYHMLTVGDLRRARSALAALNAAEKGEAV